MKKMVIFWLILIFIMVNTMTIIFVLNLKISDSNKKLPYTHSFTKAICNSENFCKDYEIICMNEQIVKISPITGAFIQFGNDWEDPRNQETRDKFC